jgi:hypothetical protein
MPNQTNSTKRMVSAKKSGVGLKALIMAASVGITLGGWGILAANQAQNALAAAPQSQAFVQSANSTTLTLSSANTSTTFQSQFQPRAITRTRSSR